MCTDKKDKVLGEWCWYIIGSHTFTETYVVVVVVFLGKKAGLCVLFSFFSFLTLLTLFKKNKMVLHKKRKKGLKIIVVECVGSL